jgi:zona occludens toxin
MIIFHEGMPRSGKSYEAVVYYLIPHILKGRKIFSNVAGLNHSKIAEVSGLSIVTVAKLVIQLTDEQVHEIYKHVENDSLVIIDELQDFFPSNRSKLSQEMTTFITRHGHRGLDILNMGQSLADCHALWKRRTEKKIVFTKLNMISSKKKIDEDGNEIQQAGSYKWVAYNGQLSPDGKEVNWIKANSGTKQYDSKYFGTYKSHDGTTKNKNDMTDSRMNVFNNWKFKYGMPAMVFVALYSVYTLYNFFDPEKTQVVNRELLAQKSTEHTDNKIIVNTKPIPQKEVQPIQQEQPKEQEPEYIPIDYLDELITKNRVRLSGLIVSEVDQRLIGYIDVLDNSYHLKERLDIKQVVAMGWKVTHQEYGIDLVKLDVRHVVTQWPIDTFGRVSEATRATPQITGSYNDEVKIYATTGIEELNLNGG